MDVSNSAEESVIRMLITFNARSGFSGDPLTLDDIGYFNRGIIDFYLSRTAKPSNSFSEEESSMREQTKGFILTHKNGKFSLYTELVPLTGTDIGKAYMGRQEPFPVVYENSLEAVETYLRNFVEN